MTSKPSDNLASLAKIGRLKLEPPDQQEFDGMMAMARRRMADLQIDGLSDDSRFTIACGAAHLLSLAALRWHGYRSDKRYLVFQCLQHTLGMDDAKWRLLGQCHKCRNLAEYEGHLDIPQALLEQLIAMLTELLDMTEQLGPINP